MDKVFMPLACADSQAMTVSVVSPDREIATNNVGLPLVKIVSGKKTQSAEGTARALMPVEYWNIGAMTQATFSAEPQPANTTSSIPSLSVLRLPAFSVTSRIVPSQAFVWLIISNSAFLPRVISVNSFSSHLFWMPGILQLPGRSIGYPNYLLS